MCHTEVTRGIFTAPSYMVVAFIVRDPSRAGLVFTLAGPTAPGFFFGGKMLKPFKSTLGGKWIEGSNYLGD